LQHPAQVEPKLLFIISVLVLVLFVVVLIHLLITIILVFVLIQDDLQPVPLSPLV
jgi:hypothetical protein